MVRLAVAADPSFTVSDIELRRTGKSYSIDTVRASSAAHGAARPLFFLIGFDAFLELPSWSEPAIAPHALVTFVVLSRPCRFFQALAALALVPRMPTESLDDLDAGEQYRLDVPIGDGVRLTLLRLPPCEVSASDIRPSQAGASAWQTCCRLPWNPIYFNTYLHRGRRSHGIEGHCPSHCEGHAGQKGHGCPHPPRC